MSEKHAPGPWRYKRHSVDSNYMLIFCSADEGEGDNLRGYCGEANARLMAAAPELLAALSRLVADGDVRDAAELGAIKQARAAIAKATGEQA